MPNSRVLVTLALRSRPLAPEASGTASQKHGSSSERGAGSGHPAWRCKAALPST
jgi:hypothetical protein